MFIEADEHQSARTSLESMRIEMSKLLQMIRNAIYMPSARSRLDSINPPEYQPSPRS